MENYFTKLNSLNVSGHVEQKNGLSYLSWSWAIAEALKLYPNLTYKVKTFDNMPYMYDEKTGYMVFTEVSIEGITREMWLPVMDSNNNAMKKDAYEYTTKWGKKSVEAATMFDVNKTIMRCLVKNLAMFGLGLYIYAGEDLPESEKPENKPITQEQITALAGKVSAKTLEHFKVSKLEDMTFLQAEQVINALNKKDVVSNLQETYPDAKINIVKA